MIVRVSAITVEELDYTSFCVNFFVFFEDQLQDHY